MSEWDIAQELHIVKTFELNPGLGLERFYSNPFLIAAFTKNPNGATYRYLHTLPQIS